VHVFNALKVVLKEVQRQTRGNSGRTTLPRFSSSMTFTDTDMMQPLLQGVCSITVIVSVIASQVAGADGNDGAEPSTASGSSIWQCDTPERTPLLHS
jgi:hypothetical protein